VQIPSDMDAFFLPFVTSWGWATWRRAWVHFDPTASGYESLKDSPTLRRKFDLDMAYPYFSMLEAQLQGQIDSWAIRWYLSVFLNQGIVLYPVKTLVENDGMDGTGRHSPNDPARRDRIAPDFTVKKFPHPVIHEEHKRAVYKYLAKRTGIYAKFKSKVGRLLK